MATRTVRVNFYFPIFCSPVVAIQILAKSNDGSTSVTVIDGKVCATFSLNVSKLTLPVMAYITEQCAARTELFSAELKRVVIEGPDVPKTTTRDLREAFDALRKFFS